jgi:nicotinic acid mononucleotide adenylyltransferase
MQTIVYGGAFDPPQQAHHEIAQRIGHEFSPKRLIVLPSGPNAFKSFKVLQDQRERLMALFGECLQEDTPAIELCDDFLLGRVPETTALSIDGFFRERIGHAPVQVFGADVIPHMPSWDPTGRVEREIPKIFVNRAGYEPDTDRVANCRFFDPELPPDISILSSTIIRQNIKNRVFAGLHPRIAEHIREHDLYL